MQRRWYRALRAVAPKTALRLEVIKQEALGSLWSGQKRPVSADGGSPHAAYLDGVVYLSDKAFQENSDQINRVNFLHEVVHHFERALPAIEQLRLINQWKREMASGNSSLHQREASAPGSVDGRAFDISKPEHFSEWLAERVAWDNERHFSKDIDTAVNGTASARLAAHIRRFVGRVWKSLRPAIAQEEISSKFRTWLGRGASAEALPNEVPQASFRDWFRGRKTGAGQSEGGDLSSKSEAVSQEITRDPITGTRADPDFDRVVANYHSADVTAAERSQAARTASAPGLEDGDSHAVGAGILAGDPSQESSALISRARTVGQTVKSFLARFDGQRDQPASSVLPLTSGHSAEAETDASQLLARKPEEIGDLKPKDRMLLEEIRSLVPFIREREFTRHIDAAQVKEWYKQQESAISEGHAQAQAFAEIARTLETLFPSTRGSLSLLEDRLAELAKSQAARGEKPRLRVVGVGGEGAAFVDVDGRGVYKLHPGGAENSAMGIGAVRPGDHQPTHVSIFRVPLTETLRRYSRQSVLPFSSPTEIKGVTENGRLITRQPLLDADHVTTDVEITRMMEQAGGRRVQIGGKGKELQHSYVVPDGKGNYLLAVDLKPANVLRDRVSSEPRLTDGVVAPITQEIVDANPQFAEFAPKNPETQFVIRQTVQRVRQLFKSCD